MGLTKQYLRYSPSSKFNIIASTNCGVKFVTYEGQEGRYVAAGACEDVILWDLRLGEKVLVLENEKDEVTCLAMSPDKRTLAAGYEEGTIRIFDLTTGEERTTFSGHRSVVLCLTFDAGGHRLASGSKDTDIILWDIVGEAGIHRLSGHKGVITEVKFLNNHNVLISSSKDTLMKFWDLDTAHCFKTIVGHRAEIWGFCLVRDETYIITGSNDSELRVWELKPNDSNSVDCPSEANEVDIVEENDESFKSPIICKKLGSLLRSGKGKVSGIVSDESGQILACHSRGNKIELFAFRSEQEAHKKWKDRLAKLRKKALKENKTESDVKEADETKPSLIDETKPSLVDEVVRLPVMTACSSIKSISIVMGKGEIRVVASLTDNSIELSRVSGLNKDAECTTLRKISAQGHRSIVRAVAFSSDNFAVVSVCGNSLKLWNRASQKCLQTVEVGYAYSVCFVPGDRHVLVGIKEGHILIVDIAAGDILERITAHLKELWSICLTPDQRGCVTGGGDKTVKFWNFELIPDRNEDSKAKILSLLHKRTLKLEENVLAVKITPNSNLIAVSLLDCTVKIFFLDTLKFFLSLYGHKLPVLCMDISYDSTVIVTGSADRNIKFWGLDFGDCHRSVFAHDDSVMSLQFVPKTHQVFTCGKDGRVKQWDADNYRKILTLQGHHGEALAVAVSPSGQYVVSAGNDKVLRLYERTMEPLVLEDEEEEEREAEDNRALATGDVTIVPGLVAQNLPSKKTVGSENIADKLLECLSVGKDYNAELMQQEEISQSSGIPMVTPLLPPIMKAYQVKNAEEFLLEILKTVRASDLEESLLLLPFAAVCDMLTLLPPLIEQGSHVELLTKIVIFLLKIHHGPIVSSTPLIPVIIKLKQLCFMKLQELRDTVGINLHGMQFIQRELEEKEGVMLFKEALVDKRSRDRKRRKRERTAKRIVL